MVVSGKMTLSLIQDAPRDTPERDQGTLSLYYTYISQLHSSKSKRDLQSFWLVPTVRFH